MGTTERRRVDEKGRVTIPQSIREALHIEPGEEVAVELDDGHVVIQPRIARNVVADLAGVVNEQTRTEDARPVDPTALKDDWTSDLA